SFNKASLLSSMPTRAPSRAKALAISLPMPPAAPVTTAILPSSLPMSCSVPASGLQVAVFDDLSPFGDFVVQVFPGLCRRIGHHFSAVALEEALHHRAGRHLDGRAAQRVDHRRGRTGGRGENEPVARLDARQGFGHGGNI